MSNETISKWLGECRHVVYGDVHGMSWCRSCHKELKLPVVNTDYENDESAWTQELWDKIEGAGLSHSFRRQLDIAILKDKGDNVALQWEVIRASTVNKSLALSRAIEEVS